MSDYYNPKRSSNIYRPGQKEAFRLSRSKIDLFVKCPRCFYLDRRLGVSQPPGFPFNLNSAVDTLLKKEFDIHRAAKSAHPLMETYGVDAVPFAHERMDEWRDALRRGVTALHGPTNLLVTGGVDDIWQHRQTKELIVVDYKATSKDGQVNLEAAWQDGYKRQMEVYQWLLRQNGFDVSATGYFVYCNGRTDTAAFDARLEFAVSLLPYTGDTAWLEPTLTDIRRCLDGSLPSMGSACDFCAYFEARRDTLDNLPVRQATLFQ
jgi:CRISPR/Cas system-associated exonuclease Cas4 (RecB family)